MIVERIIITEDLQVRHWVKTLHTHLGDGLTPKAIVDKINQARLGGATALKDRIIKDFRLGAVAENKVGKKNKKRSSQVLSYA